LRALIEAAPARKLMRRTGGGTIFKQIREGLKAGVSVNALVEQLNCSASGVYKVRNELRWAGEIPDTRNQVSAAQAGSGEYARPVQQLIAERLLQGKKVKEIVAELKCSRGFTNRVRALMRKAGDLPTPRATPRRADVARMVEAGMRPIEIADELDCSPTTVAATTARLREEGLLAPEENTGGLRAKIEALLLAGSSVSDIRENLGASRRYCTQIKGEMILSGTLSAAPLSTEHGGKRVCIEAQLLAGKSLDVVAASIGVRRKYVQRVRQALVKAQRMAQPPRQAPAASVVPKPARLTVKSHATLIAERRVLISERLLKGENSASIMSALSCSKSAVKFVRQGLIKSGALIELFPGRRGEMNERTRTIRKRLLEGETAVAIAADLGGTPCYFYYHRTRLIAEGLLSPSMGLKFGKSSGPTLAA
jgi:DNA-binding CsgD family transcriptional regulator